MRNKTARRLKNEALDIMPDRILNSVANYPRHEWFIDRLTKIGYLVSKGSASNPYKNFIRKYRRLHV